MSHFSFVAIAYAATALTIAVLVGWILFDQRGRQAELRELQAHGVRRRSERQPSGAADER